jgi:hypothetical protein
VELVEKELLKDAIIITKVAPVIFAFQVNPYPQQPKKETYIILGWTCHFSINDYLKYI